MRRSTARVARRRRSRKSPSQVAVFNRNPIGHRRRRRRRASAARTITRTLYKRNPTTRRRRHRGFRRNPIAGGRGHLRVASLVMPAFGIAVGAVGVELAMGYLPLPAGLKTGPVRHLTKGALALAAGAVLAKFANRKAGEAFAMGGLIIAFHDAMKDAALKFMPSLQFGAYMPRGLGYYSPGAQIGLRNMNTMGMLPARAGSPHGAGSFAAYVKPGFAGAASDGGPTNRGMDFGV